MNPELQSELRCQDEGRNLDQFIDLAIHLDNLIHSGRPPRVPPALNISVTEELEPMQIGHTRLTAEESTQRIKHHLWPGRTLPANLSHSASPRRPIIHFLASVVPPPNLSDKPLWGCYNLSLHLKDHGHTFTLTLSQTCPLLKVTQPY